MAYALSAGTTRNGTRVHPNDLLIYIEYLGSIPTQLADDFIHGKSVADILHDRARLQKVLDTTYVAPCMCRRFFITHGSRPGLGPRIMSPDDIVVILRGETTPFIVRKVNHHNQLVGAAYVHGIMDGEAVSEYKAKGGLEELFAFH